MDAMEDLGSTVFDTAIGPVGLAWGEHGIVAAQLPEGDAAATRRRLARRVPRTVDAEPPDEIRSVIARIVAVVSGEDADDLSDVVLDLDDVGAFEQRVYAAARTVGPGTTTTYGRIATELGDPAAAQAVGQALGHNPFPILVPCHRVVGAGGALVGFSARGGVETKRRLLVLEGALPEPQPTLFDA
jgi:methylated-DNA-[protein]-cysteine S-methyltransferase